jgi:hypothetical protein
MNRSDLERPAEKTIFLITKMGRVFDANKITLDEYCKAILTDVFVAETSAWSKCLAAIPLHVRSAFVEFARSYLLSNDFMPTPGVVDPSNNTADKVQAEMEYFRPRYIELLRVIEGSDEQHALKKTNQRSALQTSRFENLAAGEYRGHRDHKRDNRQVTEHGTPAS